MFLIHPSFNLLKMISLCVIDFFGGTHMYNFSFGVRLEVDTKHTPHVTLSLEDFKDVFCYEHPTCKFLLSTPLISYTICRRTQAWF